MGCMQCCRDLVRSNQSRLAALGWEMGSQCWCPATAQLSELDAQHQRSEVLCCVAMLVCAADVKESIAQLRYYRRNIFKKWAGMF